MTCQVRFELEKCSFLCRFAVAFVYSGVSYNSDYIGGGLHLNFTLQVLSEIPAYFLAVVHMNK